MRNEQRALLEEAVRLDPNNKTARGLLGQVSYERRWETPEAVSQRVKDDDALAAKLAEYNARRAASIATPRSSAARLTTLKKPGSTPRPARSSFSSTAGSRRSTFG